MKLRIPTAQLRAALGTVMACIQRTNTLPILDYLLIEPIQGALRLSGSNLETTISAEIPMDGIEPSAPWTAPAYKLKAIATAAPDQEIVCSVAENSLTFTSGPSRWRLPILPAEQWPDKKGPGGLKEIAIASEALQRMLAGTLPAAPKNETRFYMNGIHLETESGTLTACGTDGHRLHAAEAGGDYPDGIDLIIPRQSAQIIEATLPAEGDVILAYGPGRVRVAHPGCVIDTKLIDGRYPDWRRIIPRTESTCRVDGPEFLKAMDRAALLANERRAIRFDFQDDHIAITADSGADGDSSDCVDAELEGQSLTIDVNSTYMAAALSALGGRCRIGLTNSQTSLLIESDEPPEYGSVNVFAIVMPLLR